MTSARQTISDQANKIIDMTTESIRANTIADYIARKTPEINLAERVQVDGETLSLQVFRVPIEMLHFNIRNGRFASELIAREKQLKKSLDPLMDEDAKEIQTLLLNQDQHETDTLEADLIRHGQIDPGIITHDGAVINANRRMAILSRLHHTTREEKWGFLKVAVLPSTVTEKDLWRIEAGLQFGKDFRLKYGPINELLKLREGTNCGLDAKDISASLLGRFTEEDVKGRLKVLELIDNFLETIDRPGEYEFIGQEQLLEKFISLNNSVINSFKKRKDISNVELNDLTETAFALIKNTKLRHWDIRKLAAIARQPNALAALKSTLPPNPLDASELTLVEAFKAADDLVEDQKQKDRPERLLTKALSAVQSIDKSTKLLSSNEVQALLESLIASATALRR